MGICKYLGGEKVKDIAAIEERLREKKIKIDGKYSGVEPSKEERLGRVYSKLEENYDEQGNSLSSDTEIIYMTNQSGSGGQKNRILEKPYDDVDDESPTSESIFKYFFRKGKNKKETKKNVKKNKTKVKKNERSRKTKKDKRDVQVRRTHNGRRSK